MTASHWMAWAAVCLSMACGTAQALPPDQIFERVSPGVWSVKAYSADEKLLASASGVAVAPGKLVTSCQVLARARQLQLRRGNTIYDAKLEFPDVERDLCQLDVPGLTAPAPAAGSVRALRPGQRLYVVGFGRGNDQSIGEGLVSAVLDPGSEKERIQTTVPASRGLLGAGVYDEEARLVGVVTSSPKDAAATVFAVPADWLSEIAARGQAALANRGKPPAASAAATAPGLPAAGTTWIYGFAERMFTKRQTDVTVRVLRVDGNILEEAVSTPAAQISRRVLNTGEMRMLEHQISSSVSMIEAAPYLLAGNDGKLPADIAGMSGYPTGSLGLPGWATKTQVQDWEQVTVPAGTFRALRIDISGERDRQMFTGPGSYVGRFQITAWYAPDAKRLVRLEHKAWAGAFSGTGRQIGEDVLELLKYSPPP